jgi:hypothetical protein
MLSFCNTPRSYTNPAHASYKHIGRVSPHADALNPFHIDMRDCRLFTLLGI